MAERLLFDFVEESETCFYDDYDGEDDVVKGRKDDKNVEEDEEENDVDWSSDEIEAISSLFKGRIPQKPGKLNRERPLPLPLPYKIRPLRLPNPKNITLSSRKSVSGQLYKSPNFLIELAKEIRSLPPDEDASVVLNSYARFIRKGSLSLTIRELGHMDLPDRALQIFCWAQKQPLLFPDDRILASTVEVLARTRDLKMPFNLENFTGMASKNVYEAMIRGLIKGGNLKLSWKLLSDARSGNRVLDAGIYAKLILELGKNPDKYVLVTELLEKLGEREDLNLTQQDCTALMKICIRLEKFEIVESFFNWFKQSGGEPSIVMYTTLVHSRYTEEKYREALALVWEMESLSCLFDLPAYRVVIKLFVALKDVSRAARYFSKLKEAGFSPTFGIYRDMIKVYAESGRLAKFKEVCREAETGGFKLDKETRSILLQLER
ncbi:pentatricopeptide repeat-containing protein At2g01860 isoform X2 [Apium graveolens]